MNLELGDADSANRKSAAENSELLRQLEEVDGNISNMNKLKIQVCGIPDIVLKTKSLTSVRVKFLEN